ncbi:MAG: hypothetical protein QXE31_02810 [Candidatus Woesearchaeota archaeon]
MTDYYFLAIPVELILEKKNELNEQDPVKFNSLDSCVSQEETFNSWVSGRKGAGLNLKQDPYNLWWRIFSLLNLLPDSFIPIATLRVITSENRNPFLPERGNYVGVIIKSEEKPTFESDRIKVYGLESAGIVVDEKVDDKRNPHLTILHSNSSRLDSGNDLLNLLKIYVTNFGISSVNDGNLAEVIKRILEINAGVQKRDSEGKNIWQIKVPATIREYEKTLNKEAYLWNKLIENSNFPIEYVQTKKPRITLKSIGLELILSEGNKTYVALVDTIRSITEKHAIPSITIENGFAFIDVKVEDPKDSLGNRIKDYWNKAEQFFNGVGTLLLELIVAGVVLYFGYQALQKAGVQIPNIQISNYFSTPAAVETTPYPSTTPQGLETKLTETHDLYKVKPTETPTPTPTTLPYPVPQSTPPSYSLERACKKEDVPNVVYGSNGPFTLKFDPEGNFVFVGNSPNGKLVNFGNASSGQQNIATNISTPEGTDPGSQLVKGYLNAEKMTIPEGSPLSELYQNLPFCEK